MEMFLLIEGKEIFGRRQYKPINTTAKYFAAIANTITLTPKVLKYASEMGYEIREQTPEIKL